MKKPVFLLLAALLAFAGCAAMPEKEPQTAPVPTAAATPAPQQKKGAAGIVKNPAAGFYARYYSGCGAVVGLFQSRLESRLSAEAADTLLYLADHECKVSEGRVTFAWLYSTADENVFASSVSGAAAGRGAISLNVPWTGEKVDEAAEEDDEAGLAPELREAPAHTSPAGINARETGKKLYYIYFAYDAGRKITGTLSENCLSCNSEGEDGNWDTRVSFEGGEWVSSVARDDGIVTALSSNGDTLRFTVSRPEDRGERSLYDWYSDSSGAHMEKMQSPDR